MMVNFQDNRYSAVISEDQQYRYQLRRMWDATKPIIAFIMLNPSTADHQTDDATVRRCIGYAKRWNYGTLLVGNLFALRSTNPDILHRHPDPIGEQNDEYLSNIVHNAETTICAWGTNGSLYNRDKTVEQFLESDLYALNTTKDGHPAHPLYQKYDLEPVLYAEK